jgi:hypothetical protein
LLSLVIPSSAKSFHGFTQTSVSDGRDEMRAKNCALMMRVRHEDGRKRYYPAVVVKNGVVKPFHCFVKGKAQQFLDWLYYLRYRDAYRRRCFENVGNDVQFAVTAKKRRERSRPSTTATEHL